MSLLVKTHRLGGKHRTLGLLPEPAPCGSPESAVGRPDPPQAQRRGALQRARSVDIVLRAAAPGSPGTRSRWRKRSWDAATMWDWKDE